MIPQLLVDFYQAWGEDAHIEYHQGSVEEIVDQVHQGISELGIVFVAQKRLEVFRNIVSYKRLKFLPRGGKRLCLYVGPRHPLYEVETVDVDRPSVLSDRPQKEFAIPQQELRHLYDGEGPQGCFATDRILVDGCRVGYCYREEPEEGDENWDSGWRFTAGDESDSYMDDPGRSGIYHLNTLCNYDPDIIPLLSAPFGTAYARGEDGKFHAEPFEAPEGP